MHVHWSEFVTNDEIRSRTGQPVLSDIFRSRRLSFFGHTLPCRPRTGSSPSSPVVNHGPMQLETEHWSSKAILAQNSGGRIFIVAYYRPNNGGLDWTLEEEPSSPGGVHGQSCQFLCYSKAKQLKKRILVKFVCLVGCSVSITLQCESKKIPSEDLWQFLQNGWEFFNKILHAYYAFVSTLDYEFLFKYLQL